MLLVFCLYDLNILVGAQSCIIHNFSLISSNDTLYLPIE
jgi:hypothetical protein